MKSKLIIYSTLVVVVITIASATDSEQLNSELKDLLQKRKSLALLKSVIQELDSNLARIYKRGCDINLPGFDCDAINNIGVGKDRAWWIHSDTPGKKRACFNPDGSGCGDEKLAQLVSNRRPWIDGPGRRKRATATFH